MEDGTSNALPFYSATSALDILFLVDSIEIEDALIILLIIAFILLKVIQIDSNTKFIFITCS